MLHIWKLLIFNLYSITILFCFAILHYVQIINYYNIAALFWFKWKMFSFQLGKTHLFQYLLIPTSRQLK